LTRVISDEAVRQVAETLAPIGHQQYCRTILCLGGRASGAAEQKLERKRRRSTAFGVHEPRFSAAL
jgi:hypothetical protein